MGNAWTGDYVFSSGNLVLDLVHNFFLENGARTNKLRVYEMTKDPCAREMLPAGKRSSTGTSVPLTSPAGRAYVFHLSTACGRGKPFVQTKACDRKQSHTAASDMQVPGQSGSSPTPATPAAQRVRP